MAATKTAAAPAAAPAPVDWSSVTLAPVVTDHLQSGKRKTENDIPLALRAIVDKLRAAPGSILKVAFPSERHAKQARTLINQYARMVKVDPAPRVYIQPDKLTAHITVPASTPTS